MHGRPDRNLHGVSVVATERHPVFGCPRGLGDAGVVGASHVRVARATAAAFAALTDDEMRAMDATAASPSVASIGRRAGWCERESVGLQTIAVSHS